MINLDLAFREEFLHIAISQAPNKITAKHPIHQRSTAINIAC